MYLSPPTPHALSDFQDSHSISWDLSSYSVSSAEDDESSTYFHLAGDRIIGVHEKEQSSSHCENRQDDKCSFFFCSSAADQILRKIFPFLFISSAISTTQKVACSGEETVRHVRSASPTSVIQKKGNVWAQMLTYPVNHLKNHNSLDRQRDVCRQCCETRLSTDFALHYLLREQAIHQGDVSFQ
jgi:hypothetical protein